MVSFYVPKIIGLCGRKGSGKDTAAKVLIEKYGYKLRKFAEPLKNMLNILLENQGVPLFMRERMIEGDLKEVASGYLAGQTPRFAMQTLGTEWGRDLMGKTFWTQAFVNSMDLEDEVSRYVCTDMRFPNECQLITDLGGLTARITRPSSRNGLFEDHPSEKLIDDLPVLCEIANVGNIEELHLKIIELVTAPRDLKDNIKFVGVR